MTVIIKVGRRIHRNEDRKWFAKQIANMKNTVSIQQYMWRNIEYGFKISSIKMDREIKKNAGNSEFDFTYTKRKYKEEESLNYNIEWIEIIIDASTVMEEEEYQAALGFFSKLENQPVFKQKKNNLEVDEELSQEYHKKLKGKKAKKILQKGLDKAGKVTISRALNDVGILTIVEKLEKKNDVE